MVVVLHSFVSKGPFSAKNGVMFANLSRVARRALFTPGSRNTNVVHESQLHTEMYSAVLLTKSKLLARTFRTTPVHKQIRATRGKNRKGGKIRVNAGRWINRKKST